MAPFWRLVAAGDASPLASFQSIKAAELSLLEFARAFEEGTHLSDEDGALLRELLASCADALLYFLPPLLLVPEEGGGGLVLAAHDGDASEIALLARHFVGDLSLSASTVKTASSEGCAWTRIAPSLQLSRLLPLASWLLACIAKAQRSGCVFENGSAVDGMRTAVSRMLGISLVVSPQPPLIGAATAASSASTEIKRPTYSTIEAVTNVRRLFHLAGGVLDSALVRFASGLLSACGDAHVRKQHKAGSGGGCDGNAKDSEEGPAAATGTSSASLNPAMLLAVLLCVWRWDATTVLDLLLEADGHTSRTLHRLLRSCCVYCVLAPRDLVDACVALDALESYLDDAGGFGDGASLKKGGALEGLESDALDSLATCLQEMASHASSLTGTTSSEPSSMPYHFTAFARLVEQVLLVVEELDY